MRGTPGLVQWDPHTGLSCSLRFSSERGVEASLGYVVEGFVDFSTKPTGKDLDFSQACSPGNVPWPAGEERRKAYL